MFWIKSQIEPVEFVQWRAGNKSLNYNYDSLPGDIRRIVRAALVRDQQGLCAYTMLRITPQTCHIEHFRSQAGNREKDLEYRNLLACYPEPGVPDPPFGAKLKDDDDTLILNPHDHLVDDGFRYLSSGDIVGNSDLAKRTIDVLALNHAQLCEGRRKVMMTLVKQLRSTEPSAGWCRQRLREYEDSENLPEYYGVIRQILSGYAQRREKRSQRTKRESRG